MNRSPHDIYYRRKLPHIHPEGKPLFITFNLANSLPVRIIEELKTQRDKEPSALPENSEEHYKAQNGYFGRFDEWLDRCEDGKAWLADEGIAGFVAAKLQSMKNEYYELIAYCIMPNHIHLLINPYLEKDIEHRGTTLKYPVADILRLIKGSTARECNLKLGRTGQFWHRESYDHYVRDNEELERIILYILNNPVKAGLVKDWNSWKFTYINPELGAW